MSHIKTYVASTYFEEPLSEGNMVISKGTSFVKLEDYLRLKQEHDVALERNEYFKAEILRLSTELVDRLDERDGLAAQVELLRSEWEKPDAPEVSVEEKLENLVDIIYKTPAQCLAARDAEVVAEAYSAGYSEAWRDCSYGNGYNRSVKAEQYANQLRQAAKAGE